MTKKAEKTETPINKESDDAIEFIAADPDAPGEPGGEAGDAMPSVGQANVSEIGTTLVDEMPEVQQHAIDQEAEQQAATVEQYKDLKDRDGNSFDPAIHKTDKHGEPTITKLGKLIKKPGRKPGQKTGSGKSVVNSGGVEQSPENQKRAESRACGVASANMVLMLGIGIGGNEWQPRENKETGLDEKVMLENAFADYFEATGKTDIPPGMALTVAIGAYALPRFTMPQTQTRIGKVKQWFAKKFADRKLKKHNLEARPIDEKKPDNTQATMEA